MNHATPLLSPLSPTSRRDSLASLIHQVLVAPNAGTHALSRSCASVALAFAHLDQSDDRLAVQHHLRREQSLIKALTRALQIIEMTDLDEAVNIVGELEADVVPLVGGPIVLVCDEIIEIAPRIPEDGAAGAQGHRHAARDEVLADGGVEVSAPARTMHQPIFGTFGDYPAPPDGWARCTICRGLITAEQIEDVCPGPPQR